MGGMKYKLKVKLDFGFTSQDERMGEFKVSKKGWDGCVV